MRHARGPQPRRKADAKRGRGSVVAIVSGKGGVGKTNLALNLGILLQRRGVSTVLLDADFDFANADILLNVTPPGDFADLLTGQRPPADVWVTAAEGLRLVCGTSRSAQRNGHDHEPSAYTRAMRGLQPTCDALLVDCGSRPKPANVHLALAADVVLLVTTPEPTALADGYAMLKLLVQGGLGGRAAVVVNMARSRAEAVAVAARLDRVASDFLGRSVENVGFIPYDQHVPLAVRRRIPVCLSYPRCAATASLKRICDKLLPAVRVGIPPAGLWARVAGLFL